MVESVITLRPRQWWPKRTWRFDDALAQGALVAGQMQRRGWLKGEGRLQAGDWSSAARAVSDAEYLKYNPRLAGASELLNTAVSVANEKFDRTMRDLARRRQVEYEPELARQLTAMVLDRLIEHARSLPLKAGAPALIRLPTPQEREQMLAAAQDHGVLLAQVSRQEELDKLLAMLGRELVACKVLAGRDDLLLDVPSPLTASVNFIRQAIGDKVPDLAERLLDDLDNRRDHLWQQRTKILNWELADQAPDTINSLLADALLRTAAGTPLAGATPEPSAVADLRSQLRASLGDRLFLWQKTKDDVLKEMDSELQVPGWGNAWTQPIINRVNMLATGVRTQIGVKVFGPTGKELGGDDGAIADVQRVTTEIAQKLKTIRGAVDVVPDQSVGKRYLEIAIDRSRAARYGVNMSDVSDVVETAIGGDKITQTIEGRQRFPVILRYPRESWQDAEAIGNILVSTRTSPAELLSIGSGEGRGSTAGPAASPSGSRSPGGMGGEAMGGGAVSAGQNRGVSPVGSAQFTTNNGMQIPLRMVANIRFVEGPNAIKAENGRLRAYVTLNVRDRDIVGFVDEARQAIKPIEEKMAGTGMSIEWSGEFEHQVRARQTMAVIFPMVILAILFLLYVTFHELLDTLLVFLAVIGALCGSLMFQALFGFNFSVVVSIGYVAAFGMATETGVIMLVYLREALDRHGGLEKIQSLEQLRGHVIEGAVHRLRPKLLTEGVAIVGLVPMLWATGTGAEIMRPMAAPVLGGLLISDEVIDIMIPVMFYWIRRKRWLDLHAEQTTETTAMPAGLAPAFD
jgi:copper/silver efflux system protein